MKERASGWFSMRKKKKKISQSLCIGLPSCAVTSVACVLETEATPPFLKLQTRDIFEGRAVYFF